MCVGISKWQQEIMSWLIQPADSFVSHISVGFPVVTLSHFYQKHIKIVINSHAGTFPDIPQDTLKVAHVK